MPNRRLTQPPRLGGALPRPRLFRLNEGNEPARLLVGPSGCGKTVAASQLLAAAPAGTRTAWTRLVPEMNEAGDVAGLLAEALGQPRPGAAPGTTMEAAELVLDLLGERPVWWVVDDYHAPPPATVDALFAEVLASAPEPHRFFLCSRWRPPGLLGRTGTGLVRVVGEEDLAFTAEEARQLVAGSALSGAAITELWSATRGSPSALAVCAQAGWASVDQAVDLLVDQLLTLSEGACQEALTALALVSELNAAEVTAAGIPRSALDRLVEIGPLVQVEGGCWQLLEAARPRVLERSAEDVSLLRRRLAAGRAEEDPLSAARLLLDADDEVGAAELLAERATDLAPVEVVPFLYRLSADIRRALPPVLSAAQATVELDRALPAAEQRVARPDRWPGPGPWSAWARPLRTKDGWARPLTL